MVQTCEQVDIAIVGGGAAGLVAAIAAGEVLREGGGRVVLCETSDRVGRSILATGNGRCNFSNAQLIPEVARDANELAPLYRNPTFVAEVFAALEQVSPFKKGVSKQASLLCESFNAVLRFFADLGLVWREEGEGRLYPLANKASSVLDVLRTAVDAAEVETLTEFCVSNIERNVGGGFVLRAEDGRALRARRVVVATGGSMSERLASSLDLPFVEQHPVLGPLAVSDAGKRVTKRLDNIRVKARATLVRTHDDHTSVIRCEAGEVLFRPYGLSGIAVFDLSRDARAGDELSLCLLPPEVTVDAPTFLSQRADRWQNESGHTATYEDLLRGLVLSPVSQALCEYAQVLPKNACDEAGIERLAHALADWRFTVEGTGDARQCQVKRGGVAVEALAVGTLEAQAAPGLYVVGEAVDVDAACGGFNLHWAWASGLLAGYTAALAASEGR